MVRPAYETEPKAGLLVDRTPIPLEGVSVEATIKDFCSRVTVTQRYRNRESHPVEAVYVFPLDETAAVCGFEALIDDVHVVGEVLERDTAFERYDDAIAEGHGAYLLDQEKPDVFTASIGNVPPGKEVLVRITYVTELGLEGDDLRFVLPTTVSPRYAPASDRTGVGKTPAEAVNPPVDWKVPYGLELKANLEMPSAIRSVESPSHPVSVELEGPRATVRLGARDAAMDRDFVLLARLTEPQKPRAWVEESDEECVAMVAFQPEFDAQEAPCEIIFVVDRSGSMAGTSIAEAGNALQLCLRSLTVGTKFNIVGFGSTYATLFSESRAYNDETLAEASRYVEGLHADLGGTEILAPLKAVLEKNPSPELPRQVFVLTDGQVSNTDEVISLVRRHSHTTRVFTFGIGAGASHHLVRAMARAGEGAAEFIYPGERIEQKVMRQLAKALSPALTDVRVDWGELQVKQAPHRVPPIFAGGRVLVYGFIGEVPDQDVEVKLDAKGPKGDLSFAVSLPLGTRKKENLIATLAARAMLRDLEEGSSPLHDRKGSLQKRNGGKDFVKEEAVRLGVRYSLCSRWTSFVAVEMRETPTEGKMELRKVPVALTRGWGGLDEVARGAVPLMSVPPAAALSAVRIGDLGEMAEAAIDACLGPVSELSSRIKGRFVERGLPTRQALPSIRPLDRLVAQQHADGSWDLSTDLAGVLGKPLAELEAALVDIVGDRDQARRAWATALALIWLKIQASDSMDEWVLLEKKARRWLEKCSARLASGQEWLEAAAEVLS